MPHSSLSSPVGIGSALLMLVVALGGCTGTDAGARATSTTAAPLTSAPPPTVSADTGSIAGTVVDDSANPVAGAQAGLVERADAEARSDLAGQFTFNDLEPGTYTIVVEAIGYTQQAKKTTVQAGETTDVRFTLEAVPIEVARTQAWAHKGMITEGVGTPVAGLYLNATGKSFADWYVKVGVGMVSAVTGLAWNANSPVSAKYMFHSIWLTKGACSQVCESKNYTYGRSPLVTRMDDLELDGKGWEANPYSGLSGPCRALNFPGCVTSYTDAQVQVVVEQVFDVYLTVGYVEPLAPDFNPIPKP